MSDELVETGGGAVEDVDHSAAAVQGAGRYRVQIDGEERYIASIATPNMRIRVAAGQTTVKSGLRSVQPQTIFLDGAYAGPPFHDGERRIYSLDHHEGCIRSITLATCEQAAVALVLGLPVNEGIWNLVINEPDLDSILACWVLVNHIDLSRDDFELLKPVMPLLRVEGNIDSYGFGKEVLSALSHDDYRREQRRLEELMAPIVAAKSSGSWSPDEYEGIVMGILDATDQMLLPPEIVALSFEYQEVGRVRLRGRRIAILCRSGRGIYEVEEYLAGRYGKLLGIVVLDQGGGRFTVRRSDGFGVASLRRLYRQLNKVDPAVRTSRSDENAWGGADDIGGSPRETGSKLTGQQILKQIDRVFGEPHSILRRVADFFTRQGG